jgi:hypothetical protein
LASVVREAVRVLNEEQAHGKAKCEDAVLANSLAGQSSGIVGLVDQRAISGGVARASGSAAVVSSFLLLLLLLGRERAPVGGPVGAQR